MTRHKRERQQKLKKQRAVEGKVRNPDPKMPDSAANDEPSGRRFDDEATDTGLRNPLLGEFRQSTPKGQ